MHKKIECPKCLKQIGSNNYKRHIDKCQGIKICPVCDKEFIGNRLTVCSMSCSNKLFRSGEDHPNWKGENYRTICFMHHERKCVACGEELVVAVHHLNEDHHDNRPENLIPLCPTHHVYMHSKYRSLIQEKVDKYIANKFGE